MENLVLLICMLYILNAFQTIDFVRCLKCFQCDSDENDECLYNNRFGGHVQSEFLVDCFDNDADTLAHMCVKLTKRSEDSFYDWGWKTVVRRCARFDEFSATWGCRYSTEDNDVKVETCYCSDMDGCNSSNRQLVVKKGHFIWLVACLTKLTVDMHF